MPQESQVKNRELVVFLEQGDFFENSLSERVKKIIRKIPDRNLTLSEIISLLGNDGLLIFASILLMIPLGLMPIGNTLPALIILFLSIGIIQKGGTIILLDIFLFLGL